MTATIGMFILLTSLGIFFVLWGLKIYKFFIIVIGILVGAGVFFCLCLLIAVKTGFIAYLLFADHTIDDQPIETIMSFLSFLFALVFGGFLGGLLALTFHKIGIFIANGFCIALLGIIPLILLQAPIAQWYVFEIILFIFGGVISVWLHEYIVIVDFSIIGTLSLFCAYIFHYFPYIKSERLENFLKLLGHSIIPIALSLIVFTIFAIYYQKIKAIRPDDSKEDRISKICLKRITYIYISIGFISTLLRYTDVTNINLTNWPIITILTWLFVSWLNRKLDRNSSKSRTEISKYISLMIFGLTVVPIITTIVSPLVEPKFLLLNETRHIELNHNFTYHLYEIYEKVDKTIFPNFSIIIPRFFLYYLDYLVSIKLLLMSNWEHIRLGIKWFYSIIMLPGLLYFMCSKKINKPEQNDIGSIEKTLEQPKREINDIGSIEKTLEQPKYEINDIGSIEKTLEQPKCEIFEYSVEVWELSKRIGLKFRCQTCGKDIIVKFLKIGEIAKCRACGSENVVPKLKYLV